MQKEQWLGFLNELHNKIRGSKGLKLTGLPALNEISNFLVLYFIDYKTFCLVDYSEIPYGNKNMTGTYRFTSDSLFLTFHPKIIIFGIKWKGEPYVSEGKTYLKKRTEKIFPLSFRIDKCQNDALMLTNAKVRKYSFGFKTKDDANEKMADLIESKEWKKLRQ